MSVRWIWWTTHQRGRLTAVLPGARAFWNSVALPLGRTTYTLSIYLYLLFVCLSNCTSAMSMSLLRYLYQIRELGPVDQSDLPFKNSFQAPISSQTLFPLSAPFRPSHLVSLHPRPTGVLRSRSQTQYETKKSLSSLEASKGLVIRTPACIESLTALYQASKSRLILSPFPNFSPPDISRGPSEPTACPLPSDANPNAVNSAFRPLGDARMALGEVRRLRSACSPRENAE
jgi:hypothetical protein